MKKAGKFFGIIVFTAIIGLVVSGCSDGSNYDQDSNLGITFTVLLTEREEGAPGFSVKNIAPRSTAGSNGNYLEFYIYNFKISEDANPRGLWFVGDFDQGSQGGQLNNRKWFDVLKNDTYTVHNDFNNGKFSQMLLEIGGIRGKINGTTVELGDEGPGQSILFSDAGDYPNSEITDKTSLGDFWQAEWDGITIQKNSTELTATLYIEDIFNFFDPARDPFFIRENWQKYIKVDVQVK